MSRRSNRSGSIGDSAERVTSSDTPVPVVGPRRAIVIGLGHSGRRTLEELTRYSIPCTGVDMNIENVRTIGSLGINAIYGDATSPDVLHSAGIHEAFLVVITVSGKHITPKIMAVVRSLNPDTKIIARIHYLMELQDFSEPERNCLVVSELEAANALTGKVLACYGFADRSLSTNANGEEGRFSL